MGVVFRSNFAAFLGNILLAEITDYAVMSPKQYFDRARVIAPRLIVRFSLEHSG